MCYCTTELHYFCELRHCVIMALHYSVKDLRSYILIILAVLVVSMQSERVSHIRKLYKDLFSNYTKQVMPVYDHSKPLMVGVTFYLISINSFNEVEETISIAGSFSFNWTDPFLAWDPASYGHQYWTVIDSSDMWVPFMVLTNNVNKMEPIGGETNFNAFIITTGDVVYNPGDVLEAKCPTDISKFPFDEQQCTFTFIAWAIPKQFLRLSSLKDQASLDYFYPHSDWTLLEYSTVTDEEGGDISFFSFNLKIKRRAMYYGVMVIAPTVLFALLNPLVFLLPVESGERVGLAMTILLSYSLFLMIVSSSIPASSNPMCALLIVMVIIIVVSGIIAFGVILTVKYYNEEDVDKIGPALKSITSWQSHKDTDVGESVEAKYNITGKDVANMLDTIFFYGSYVVMILTTVGYSLYVFL